MSSRFNPELLKIKGFSENADGTYSKGNRNVDKLHFPSLVEEISAYYNCSTLVKEKGFLTLNVTPYPAPRMTISDKWKSVDSKNPKYRQRPCVTRYFAFKDTFMAECKRVGYSLEKQVDVEFHLPMPKTWSKKKKAEMDGEPHQQKPDIDNCQKSFFDAFGKDDSFVWSVTAKKFWAITGKIIIHK